MTRALLVLALLLAAVPTRAADVPSRPDPSCVLPTIDGEPNRMDCLAQDRLAEDRAAPTSAPLPCVEITGIDERCEVWSLSHDASPTGAAPAQFPADVALSPDDATAFVAMEEQDGDDPWTSPSNWVVAAHDATTGAQRWRIEVGGMRAQSFPSALAVAPDGGTLFVAGSDREAFGGGESATVVLALDPGTGTERWRARFDGPGGTDNPRTLVADDRGVYVAVISANGTNADLDFVLWGIEPDTGVTRFATRWAGIGAGRVDTPFDIGVSPDGELVVATGWSAGPGEFNVDFGTVAVRATGEDPGEVAWEARYDGEGGRGPDQSYALELDDEHVYVTGYSNDLDAGPPFAVNYEFATLAYDLRTGAQAWEARRVWGEDNWSTPTELALDDGRVFVAGQTSGEDDDADYAVQAIDAGTGAQLWAQEHALEAHDFEVPLAIAAEQGRLYVTGISSSSTTSVAFGGQASLADQATVVYEAATGARVWVARYNDSGYDDDAAVDIAVTRDGSRVITLAQLVRNIQMDADFYDVGLAAYDD